MVIYINKQAKCIYLTELKPSHSACYGRPM